MDFAVLLVLSVLFGGIAGTVIGSTGFSPIEAIRNIGVERRRRRLAAGGWDMNECDRYEQWLSWEIGCGMDEFRDARPLAAFDPERRK